MVIFRKRFLGHGLLPARPPSSRLQPDMPLPPANQPISETDYEAIEAAVMETARGRWFLDEYAQRNRNADTMLVLEAIQRLQRSVLGAETAAVPAPDMPAIQGELNEIERTIERTRRELAEIDSARLRDGNLGNELEEIVAASAQAITEVLSDAERIQEISTTMRAQGVSEGVCDQLDGLATHINTACAFQDLTGQRTGKVAAALRLLEARVQSLVQLWQAESTAQAPARDALLNGPQREGEALEQDQIDELLTIDRDHDVFWNDKQQQSGAAETAQPEAPAKRAVTRDDIEKLPAIDRIALFS
jgi:chemotaxis protein CheZ